MTQDNFAKLMAPIRKLKEELPSLENSALLDFEIAIKRAIEKKETGVYKKFKIIRHDGRELDPESFYFVLAVNKGKKPELEAIRAYAIACEKHYPNLSDGLKKEYDKYSREPFDRPAYPMSNQEADLLEYVNNSERLNSLRRPGQHVFNVVLEELKRTDALIENLKSIGHSFVTGTKTNKEF